MTNKKGFTIIEIMIVVVVIGLLAAVVLPSYQSSVHKSRRADARAALAELGVRQEKFFAQNNTYTTEVSAEDGLALGRTTSRALFYNLTVTACAGGAISRCYLLTATATGLQADDQACFSLAMDNVGRKTAKDYGGDSTPYCW